MSEDIKQIILEKIKFGAATVLTKEFLDELKLDIHNDILYSDLVLVLKWWALGKKVSQSEEKLEDEVVYYPSNWKEAFKERWFYSFLKRKFPIKYDKIVKTSTHITKVYNVCPHINSKFPGNKEHIEFLENKKRSK